jgi:hypothetical protein
LDCGDTSALFYRRNPTARAHVDQIIPRGMDSGLKFSTNHIVSALQHFLGGKRHASQQMLFDAHDQNTFDAHGPCRDSFGSLSCAAMPAPSQHSSLNEPLSSAPPPTQREVRRILYVSNSMEKASPIAVCDTLRLLAHSSMESSMASFSFDTAKDGFEALHLLSRDFYHGMIVNGEGLMPFNSLQLIRTVTADIPGGNIMKIILVEHTPPDLPSDQSLICRWHNSNTFHACDMRECIIFLLTLT